MKAKQDSHKAHSKKDIDKEQYIDYEEAKLTGRIQPSQGHNNLYEHKQTHQKQSSHKAYKPFIVTFTHTGTYPRTVMIESLNTDVTFITVRSTRWSVDVTV
jgi:hypothetical protein